MNDAIKIILAILLFLYRNFREVWDIIVVVFGIGQLLSIFIKSKDSILLKTRNLLPSYSESLNNKL